MGALPEFAPAGEDHLLRSTSVVQDVSYGERRISYRTFDAASTEFLRLHFKPLRVSAGESNLALQTDLKQEGYAVRSLAGADYVVGVRHVKSGEITLTGR